MANPITLGGHPFESRIDARKYFYGELNKLKDREQVTDKDLFDRLNELFHEYCHTSDKKWHYAPETVVKFYKGNKPVNNDTEKEIIGCTACYWASFSNSARPDRDLSVDKALTHVIKERKRRASSDI